MLRIHEAMKQAAGEQRTSVIAEIAHRLHLTPSTVYKWTQPSENPTDSGSRGPGAVLLQYMESCLILGRHRKDALAPLDFLEHRFNRIAIDIPETCRELALDDISAELIKVMKECGDVVEAYHNTIGGKRISRNDLRCIEREVWEAATQLMVFLYRAREAAGKQ
jgi:hypothetical protein